MGARGSGGGDESGCIKGGTWAAYGPVGGGLRILCRKLGGSRGVTGVQRRIRGVQIDVWGVQGGILGARGELGGADRRIWEVPGVAPPSPLPMTSPHLWVGMEKVISPPGGPQLPWPRPRPRPPGGSPGPGGPGGPLCGEGVSGVGRAPKTGGHTPKNIPDSSPK